MEPFVFRICLSFKILGQSKGKTAFATHALLIPHHFLGSKTMGPKIASFILPLPGRVTLFLGLMVTNWLAIWDYSWLEKYQKMRSKSLVAGKKARIRWQYWAPQHCSQLQMSVSWKVRTFWLFSSPNFFLLSGLSSIVYHLLCCFYCNKVRPEITFSCFLILESTVRTTAICRIVCCSSRVKEAKLPWLITSATIASRRGLVSSEKKE